MYTNELLDCTRKYHYGTLTSEHYYDYYYRLPMGIHTNLGFMYILKTRKETIVACFLISIHP